MKRQAFIGSAASAAALALGGPESALAQGTGRFKGLRTRLYTRLEVTQFSADPALVQALRNGVQAMMDVTDPKDPRSWDYWHNSHWMASGSPPPDMANVWNQCKHHRPYFYAWHRGYVLYFERMLRQMAATKGPVPASFALPYWDYYKHPQIPKIYADKMVAGKKNPLYNDTRTGTTMAGLSFAPYDSTIVNFPRGFPSSYEPLVESNPHDSVHGQVGGDMGSVPTAPSDPIFYAHHCNIDRLWSCWLKADAGRKMPPSSDPWWKPSFIYNTAGTWKLTVPQLPDNVTNLGYTFSDLSLPSSGLVLPRLPLIAATAKFVGPQLLGQTQGIALGPRSISVAVPLPAPQRARFHALAASAAPASVELDGVELTDAGQKGGYSYDVYVDLPPQGGSGHPAAYYVGTLNSFSVSVAQLHGGEGAAHLSFPLSGALQQQVRAGTLKDDQLTVSFVRAGQPSNTASEEQFVKIARVRVVTGAAAMAH
jgi:tyrosinase